MKLIKLFLVLGLINYSLIAAAAGTPNTACIDKDKKVAPPVAQRTTTDSSGNTVDTQVWKDWKDSNAADWQVRQGWGCCEKLVLNATTSVCEDKSVADQGLVSCSDHLECTGDKGCLSWREEDMFDESRVTSEAEKTALNAKAEEFEKAREEYDELSPVGGFCFTNMQCESYKCSGMQCKENKVCRLADENDPATPAKVKCEEPFKKNPQDKCENPNQTYYNGLLGEIIVNAKGDGQCQFELVPTAQGTTAADIPRAINLAIVTTRAAEWLFSTLSKSDSMSERDCVYAKDYFRDKAIALVNKRKEIIKEFNREFKLIEDDFAEIQAAKKDEMDPITTICGDTTTKHDVAMRKASGKDFLCYMRERNKLFLHYEEAMFAWVTEFNTVFTSYESDIKNWGEKDKNWNIGGRAWDWKSARTCRHWIDLWVGVITPKKLKNRWINRYRAKISSTSEMYHKYVETIGVGGNADRLSRWHWVLDPLSPGRENMSVENFVKSLRMSEIPEKDFIHEPEIASSYELRGCINEVNSERCVRYKKYLQDLKDVALAQQLMYSHHTKRKYKDYYKNEGSSRRRLISRYVTDAANLLNYYKASTSLRTQQNACIERVLTQLEGDDFKGDGTGIKQDSTNYYQATTTNYAGSSNNAANYNKPKIKKSTRAPIKFNLSSNRNSLKDGANKDSVDKSAAGGSGSMDSAAVGALAARTKDLMGQNAKVTAAGTEVKKMEGDIVASLGAGSGTSATGRGSSFGSMGASGSGSGADAGKKATLGDDAAKTDAMSGKGIPSGAGAGMNAGAGIAAGSMAGIVGGSASGTASGSGAGDTGAVQDPTGMSDEEKDVMAQNYDRNKSDYKTKDDDSLFQVLSKTYVRNLDKILTRKKKLDEDSASHPSTPSTP